jgi:hypothetical protein
VYRSLLFVPLVSEIRPVDDAAAINSPLFHITIITFRVRARKEGAPSPYEQGVMLQTANRYHHYHISRARTEGRSSLTVRAGCDVTNGKSITLESRDEFEPSLIYTATLVRSGGPIRLVNVVVRAACPPLLVMAAGRRPPPIFVIVVPRRPPLVAVARVALLIIRDRSRGTVT